MIAVQLPSGLKSAAAVLAATVLTLAVPGAGRAAGIDGSWRVDAPPLGRCYEVHFEIVVQDNQLVGTMTSGNRTFSLSGDVDARGVVTLQSITTSATGQFEDDALVLTFTSACGERQATGERM
ncbi:MAG: hypothetical protein JWL84_5805 [Rhodospirillales bacterium]|jgi:hypothetical protein|nr:hypothetical protein [Rhodospirillales bacterium]